MQPHSQQHEEFTNMMPRRYSPSDELRGAIALNNASITLLERHAYRLAAHSLKEAIFVMQSILQQANASSSIPGNSSSTTAPAGASVRHHHQEAAERDTLDAPSPSASCDAAMTASSNVNDKVDLVLKMAANIQPSQIAPCPRQQVCPLSYDGSYLVSPSVALFDASHPSTRLVVPVRMEVMDHDGVEDMDVSAAAGIILYNFGIAQLCLSRCLARPQQHQQHPSAESLCCPGNRCLEDALMLFKKGLSAIVSTDSPDHSIIACVMMSHIVQAQLDSGNPHEAHETYQKMMQAVRIEARMMDVISVKALHAAAA